MGVSEMTLEVRVSNGGAIALYTSLGFIEVGLRKKYYASTWTQPAEDALLLTLFHLDQEEGLVGAVATAGERARLTTIKIDFLLVG